MTIRFAAIPALCLLLCACAAPGGKTQVFTGEPAGLIGLQDAQIRTTFGTPVFVRKDAGTEMWRYDGASCHAFFFFNSTNGALAVHHVETLPHGNGTGADSTCLAALQAHGAKPVS
ncbi:MAG TPA: hypothetical protein VH000_05490 [Rhizomicrobium sp.]|jgi:hypothetical protein|nr:hypothetical protein [Rhizomicrobium sp.]